MKTLLSNRPEQYTFDELLLPSLEGKVLDHRQERNILVSHPELSPIAYETKIDNWYLLKAPEKKQLSFCFDLHGTWHEKEHVGVWDWKKRQVLEHNGHHYIEIRNFGGAEECPSLWQASELGQKINDMTGDPSNLTKRKVFYDKYQETMQMAANEIGYQILLQLALNHPRKIDPVGL